MKPSSLQRIILRHLTDRPMTARELADATGSDEHTIRTSIDLLCERGMVRRNGFSAGRYPKQRFEVVA